MLKYLGCRTLDIGNEDESEAFLNINNHHNQLNTVKPLWVYCHNPSPRPSKSKSRVQV